MQNKRWWSIGPSLLLSFFLIVGCESNTSTNTEKTDLENKVEKLEKLVTSIKTEKESLEQQIKVLQERNQELEEKFIQNAEEEVQKLKDETGLANIQDIDNSIVVDLKYATEDNFVHQKVYPVALCLLQEDTALKLKKANERFKKDGYIIKIWDGYRPLDVQKIFWELLPDSRYVSNPATSIGSGHNKGTSVDITLVDQNGKELEMPTAFDDFSPKAGRSYQGNSEQAQKNMEYLTKVMVESGFKPINTEWWHFNDTNEDRYSVLNIPLERFIVENF